MSDTELGGFDPQSTYDSASQDYVEASRDFWLAVSHRTVDTLQLAPGDRVLDAACGPGWSAIEAARRVTPGGHVVAVDFAPQMLALARAQAEDAGVTGIEWRQADMTTLDDGGAYDAVICVLGLFFIEDMVGQARRFLQLLRPGGRLGIGALGENVFTPLVGELRQDVAAVRPDIDWVLPWERLSDPDRLHQILSEAGGRDIEIIEQPNPAVLDHPEDWWRMVLGSGLRRYITEIDPDSAEQIRQRHLSLIQERGVSAEDLDILVARCEKPS